MKTQTTRILAFLPGIAAWMLAKAASPQALPDGLEVGSLAEKIQLEYP